jgi:cardiolipin synthase (CMP-forming)
VLIVGAFILSWVVGKPLVVAPSIASKFNTAGQIILAGVVLGFLGLDMGLMPMLNVGFISVAILTFGSGALYMKAWLRHMANGIQGDKT